MMRFWVAILMVCVMLSGVAWGKNVVRPREGAVRVMTYNIRYATKKDGVNQWENRKELVASMIREQEVDLFGVQEAMPEQWRYLRGRFKDYGSWINGRADGKTKGEACGIFYSKKRFRLLEKGQVWLSETPSKVGRKGWDAKLPRLVNWLRLKDLKEGKDLWVLNTHWDHRGKRAREESAKLITKWVAEHVDGEWGEKRVVVMGDMNCEENDRPAEIMREKFVDAYRRLNEKSVNEGTFNGFKYKTDGKRIDFVFYDGGLKAMSAKHDYTVKSEANGEVRLPSDHYPVVVGFDYVDAAED